MILKETYIIKVILTLAILICFSTHVSCQVAATLGNLNYLKKQTHKTVEFHLQIPKENSWQVHTVLADVEILKIANEPSLNFSAKPNGYSELIFLPPDGIIDLSSYKLITFELTNQSTKEIQLTAWLLSGPGWGGSPSEEQIKSDSGRIVLAPNEEKIVIIDLHKKYPGRVQSPCVDATNITKLKLVLQPGHTGPLVIKNIQCIGRLKGFKQKDVIKLSKVTQGDPKAGQRVLQQLPQYENTSLKHVIGLPENWKKGGSYPILVDYPGNVFYHKYCHSSGRAQDSAHGASITAETNCILLQLPFVHHNLTTEATNGWGDPDATIAYAKVALEDTIVRYGGRADFILFSGFSRGAYAADYIALRTDRIATLWKGFILSAGHPKSIGGWNGSSEGFAERLKRLGNRPIFLNRASWEGAKNIVTTNDGLGSSVHADIGLLRCKTSKKKLTKWIYQISSSID